MPTWFALFVAAVATLAGAIAAVAGTGVGSLVTPALSLRIDMRDAVLAVAAPHLVLNALRFWSVRTSLSGKIFRRFGLTSAGGSLAGALLQHSVSSGSITAVFAVLLIIAALFGLTGLADRVKFGRRGAYAGGALSGFFGGLTGEQGGLRAAAMLGLDLSKETFVATATATALVVDAVRIPVYLATRWNEVPQVIAPAAVGVAGVVAGMFIGKQLFGRVPRDKFSRVVSAVLLLIGALLVVRLLVMSGKRTSASVSNHEDFDWMEKVSDEQDHAAAVFAE